MCSVNDVFGGFSERVSKFLYSPFGKVRQTCLLTRAFHPLFHYDLDLCPIADDLALAFDSI